MSFRNAGTKTTDLQTNQKDNNLKTRFIAVFATVVALVLASCSIDDQYATPTSDSHLCVFDGSERGGQKLKFQLAPSAESRKIDDNDQVVKIPASNRFYATTKNGARRDPLASEFYDANARGSDATGTVPIQIEGQIRFKFNYAKNACEWYSLHGRRNADENGDLGFNARGNDALTAGWFKFLTENFGQTMDQAVVPVALGYNWNSLVYNYPVNADSDGKVPDGKAPGIPTQTDFGNKVAVEFTNRLNKNLGGQYFCGVDSKGDECTDLTFEVTRITGPAELMDAQAAVEKTRSDLERDQVTAQLQEQQLDATIRGEKARQAQLAEEIRTADLQAQKDSAFCRAITAVNPNLNCKGELAPVIVGGQ